MIINKSNFFKLNIFYILLLNFSWLQAQLPLELELSTLDGKNGFVINGLNPSDHLGFSVSGAGDFNGDLIPDILIGAQDADPNSINNAGSTYLIFGHDNEWATSFDIQNINNLNGVIINGESADDRFGGSVNNIGDVNGDGLDDVIGCASHADKDKLLDVGSCYVIYGSNLGFTSPINLIELSNSDGFKINGINENDYLGVEASEAGDINNDGFDDIIIGSTGADPNGNSRSGSAYVIFGKNQNFNSPFDLSILDGSNGFILNGIDENDHFARSVNNIGDINGDGINDLGVGANLADPNGLKRSGSTYIIFGRNHDFPSSIEMSSLDSKFGFIINGLKENEISGSSVASAGDLNADGIEDLIIGVYGDYASNLKTINKAYVVFGSKKGFSNPLNLSTINGINGLVFKKDRVEGDNSTTAISGAGDVNGDGISDIVIGFDQVNSNGTIYAGITYLIYGRSGGFPHPFELDLIDSGSGMKIYGNGQSDFSGVSVSDLGDINGDGLDDIAVGAAGRDSLKHDSGRSYVIFGNDTLFNSSFEL